MPEYFGNLANWLRHRRVFSRLSFIIRANFTVRIQPMDTAIKLTNAFTRLDCGQAKGY
jgi:hypothetical protein